MFSGQTSVEDSDGVLVLFKKKGNYNWKQKDSPCDVAA